MNAKQRRRIRRGALAWMPKMRRELAQLESLARTEGAAGTERELCRMRNGLYRAEKYLQPNPIGAWVSRPTTVDSRDAERRSSAVAVGNPLERRVRREV